MATAVEAPASAEGLVQHTRFQFQPAVRHRSHLRIGIDGVSGSGRTLTALLMASGLGERVAVIDTNGGAADRYAHRVPHQILTMTRFDPDDLFTALAVAASTDHDVAVVDTVSAYWSGPGGLLEKVDRDTQIKGGTTSAAWTAHRPSERRLLGALKAYPGAVVLVLNSLVEPVIEDDGNGGHVVRRIPVRAEQRAGLEYDLTFTGSMDNAGAVLDVTKSPIEEGTGRIEEPGEKLGKQLRDWAQLGEPTGLDLSLVHRARDRDLTLDALVELWAQAAAARALDMAVLDMDGRLAVTLLELLAQRTYQHLGATDLTMEGLWALGRQAEDAQALQTAVPVQGRPMALGTLLEQRRIALVKAAERERKEAEQAAARAAREEAQRARLAAQQPTDPTAEQDGSQGWPPYEPPNWPTAGQPEQPWAVSAEGEGEYPEADDPTHNPQAQPAQVPPFEYAPDIADSIRPAAPPQKAAVDLIGHLAQRGWNSLPLLEKARSVAEEQGVLDVRIIESATGGEHPLGVFLNQRIIALRGRTEHA
ncbi:AAA family ATPase [Streptacidiphilus sp. EB103A]|uniref:AAA family ATPase n=1 Tax=Streptacidiphilus sp. EB103A TaxID=3156275 RepID=UPI003518FC47